MFCFLPESWWPVPSHSQLWECLSSYPFPTVAQNAPSTPLLAVLGQRSQCVGPGFSFFWEKLQTASVSQATLWIDGGRNELARGDLGCSVRPQWRVVEGGALPEAIWGPNSMARQGLPPPGPSVGARAEPRRDPGAGLCPTPRLHPSPALAPRPACTVRPYSPAPAAPRPSGTGSQATGRGPGRRQRSCKSHDFPAYINHRLFFSTGCRLKGAVSSFSPKGRGSPGCL